jgi:hypothetical protein
MRLAASARALHYGSGCPGAEDIMTDTERGASPEGQDGAEAPPTLADVVDGAARRISTAIVLAGAVLALGIYARPAPPRFEAFAADGRIVRIDTKKGTVLACEHNRCMTIVERGQRLKPLPERALLPKPDAPRPQQ